MPTEESSFEFLLLLISLTFKTNVNVLDLHHDVLLNFRQVIELLNALLSGNTSDISQKTDRIWRIYISRVGQMAVANLLFFKIVDFVFD